MFAEEQIPPPWLRRLRIDYVEAAYRRLPPDSTGQRHSVERSYLAWNTIRDDIVDSMTALCEILLFVINLCFPIYLVVRWGWRGVIGGAFCMWVTVYLSGEIQRAGDPGAERFAMGAWLIAGLLFTFAYCGIVYGTRQLVLFARARWGNFDVTKVRYKV
jgi:hypothetical protein